MTKTALLLLFLALLVAAGGLASDATPVALPIEALVIETSAGRHEFMVEIASTTEAQTRGLMFRDRLDDDAGMLFVYPRAGRITMWMKNTLIPLDMLFIDRQGIIVTIARNTHPYSLETIGSGKPVVAVLEIGGGRSAALGINEGDTVLHAAFKPIAGAGVQPAN